MLKYKIPQIVTLTPNVLYSGFDGGRYPFPMSVTFGLSVQF